MDTKNFDLNDCTRDGLCLVLKTARNEIAKYNSCSQKVEECEKSIEGWKKKLIFRPIINPNIWFDFNSLGCFAALFAILILFYFWFTLLPIWLISCPFEYIYYKTKKKPNAQNNIDNLKQELIGLQKNKTVSISEFQAIWLIPQKYWDEYALTTMLEFVENREASNWERVTDLYRDHKHKLKIEVQTMIQTELAEETRNATRLAAAGAWAAAAGAWRR